MNTGSQLTRIIRPLTVLALLLPGLLGALPASARQAGDRVQRYVIEFADPPLALYDGRALSVPTVNGSERLEATAPRLAGGGKLDRGSQVSRAYLDYLAARQADFRAQASALLGRELRPVYSYRMASNGMAVDLTTAEAERLARSPLLKSIEPDQRYRLETDAGPPWLGADEIWNGLSGFPASRGEGIVIGVIDTGINWDHPSFADPAPDGYNHSNPFGSQLGLCDDAEVMCNDKLIGVYDFVEDDPDTEDVVEENTKGKDNDGHGSHVSSIAAGNQAVVTINGGVNVTLSGVAAHANLVMYRVCYIGEPQGPDSGGCMGSAILAAVDQAVTDGVDVINYSVGSSAGNPWSPGSISRAYLAARGAGIFVVTSNGNAGPNPETIGSPANAPWIMAAGNASSNRIFALGFDLLDGPTGLACVEGNGPAVESTIGPQPVVFAGDVGDTFGCSAFPADSMSGAIALVSRGECLFATKVNNAFAAGADVMVVYNNVGGLPITMDLGVSKIPSCMISNDQGIAARDFVQANPGAEGRIDFPVEPLVDEAFADIVSDSSSRGPTPAPAEDVLKPNVITPGTSILAAGSEGEEFIVLSGTSMASPHVAGAAALLKSVHNDWSPSQLASAIEMTATPELATVSDGSPATPHDRGAGRPQLGQAVNAGLFLDVTEAEFNQADPVLGGAPRDLNLPSLVDTVCRGSCSFSRTVTDQMGGGDWTATPVDFPDGVVADVTPAEFSLGNGASQSLDFDIDLAGAGIVGEWVFGRIRLSAAGSPDQFLTVAVYADGGELPSAWFINDDRDGGWTTFQLDGLAAMPDATFRSGGLEPVDRTVEILEEDPTDGDPYDGGTGVFTKWYPLPQGGLWLYAETIASTARDLDLFVGRDDDEDGRADEDEELCGSTSTIDLEHCNLYDLEPGDYWIVVQNWDGTNAEGDEATLLSAAIGPATDSPLAASGPGIIAAGESFDLRLSWDNLGAAPGEEWLGAVGIGTRREQPNNIGVIPVHFNRNGVAAPETFPLFTGREHRFALDAGGMHDRLFIDVPPGATSLEINAYGLDLAANDGLQLDLKRLAFDDALSPPPFAAAPGGAPVVASAGGGGGNGPNVTVSGNDLQPGRWYPVLTNGNDTAAGIVVEAILELPDSSVAIHRGLWEPSSRPGLGQGYEYNWGGSDRALIWYSYDEARQPAWYIAGAPAVAGDVWTAPLYRVTNDGMQQQLAAVGTVSVTNLAEDDALFSYTLFGQSGTERMQPLSPPTCPQVNGDQQSYTGLWYRGVDGLGGASVLVNSGNQAQIHYLFDADGRPRWLVAQDPDQQSPTQTELPLLQFTGFCAVCADTGVSFETIGVLERNFSSETTGDWSFDYLFEPPLSGSSQRSDQIVKLTDTLECQ